MISDQMFASLQQQITAERTNAAVYAQLAIEMERAFWPGLARFFRHNSGEEADHAHRLIDYLTDQDRYPAMEALPSVSIESATPLSAFQSALDLEILTTAKINAIYQQARNEGDFATEGTLDWFITEQVRSVKDFQQYVAEIGRADAAYLKLLNTELGGE